MSTSVSPEHPLATIAVVLSWRWRVWLSCGLLSYALGCQHTPPAASTSEQAFSQAETTFAEQDYLDSIDLFESFITRYPYSKHQAKARLKLAEALFHAKMYASSASAFQRFRILHPSHQRQDYAFYMEGLNYWKMAPKAADKAQTNRYKALNLWAELRRNHPQSAHLNEATPLIQQGQQHLIKHQFLVVRFYCRAGQWLGCIFMVEDFINHNPHLDSHDLDRSPSLSSQHRSFMSQAAQLGLKAVRKLTSPRRLNSLDLSTHLLTRHYNTAEFSAYLLKLMAQWEQLTTAS